VEDGHAIARILLGRLKIATKSAAWRKIARTVLAKTDLETSLPAGRQVQDDICLLHPRCSICPETIQCI
jgi:hypothetical protein